MQLQKTFMSALLVSTFLGSPSMAADGSFVGAKWGVVDVEGDALDPAQNLGVLTGYQFSNGLGAEGEFTTTVVDGDLYVLGMKGGWSLNSAAAYGTYRLGDALFMKARAGFMWQERSGEVAGISVSESDTNLSWGVAAGYAFADQHTALEAGYTSFDDEASMWSMGVNYGF